MTERLAEIKRLPDEASEMREKLAELEDALRVQKRIAFAAGLFQGDVTVRTMLESLAEGLIVLDSSGVVSLVNKRAQEIFGYKQNELIGRNLSILLPQRYADVHGRHMSTYFENPRIRPMGQGFELVGKHKDGSEFPIEVSLSYLETEAGCLGLAFITEITKRKAAEQALKEQNEALDAFSHMVAHDINVSLALIVGVSEALLEEYETLSPQALHRYLHTIAQSGRKASTVVNGLLLLASICDEDLVLNPLDMHHIVHEALQRLEHIIEETAAEIVLTDRFPEAIGYGPWVEEVWFNYISNALRYGGRPPKVEIGGCMQDGGYAHFWVSDNGAGLTEEQRAWVFSPRLRLQHSHEEGYGLGLSIVRRIIDKLGGQVGVDCELGYGCTFCFTLAATE